MTKRIYRSARGKSVDLGSLILQNENTRAVGNMGVNTRGDKINANNEVIEPKTQIMEKRYEKHLPRCRVDWRPLLQEPKKSNRKKLNPTNNKHNQNQE